MNTFLLTNFLSICDAPRAWGVYFQDSASPQMEALVELHDNIMFYLVIVLFGVGWILVSIIRNYVSSKSPPALLRIYKDITIIILYAVANIILATVLYPEIGNTVAVPGYEDLGEIMVIGLLGLLLLISTSIYTGYKWLNKSDKTQISLWISPVIVIINYEAKLAYIDHYDKSCSFLAALLSNISPQMDNISSVIRILTPVGIYKGFVTSNIISGDIIETLVSGSLSRYSIKDSIGTGLSIRINTAVYSMLSRRYVINIYTGFNCMGTDSFYYTNYHLHSNIYLLGPSTITALTVPLNLGSVIVSTDNLELDLKITPLFFSKNCIVV